MKLGSELIKKLDVVELENYKNELKNESRFSDLMAQKHLNLMYLIYVSFIFHESIKGMDYWYNVAKK